MRRTRFPQLSGKTERILTQENVLHLEKHVKVLEDSLREMYETLKKAAQEGNATPDAIDEMLKQWREKLQIKLEDFIPERPDEMEEKKKLWLELLEVELKAKQRWLGIRERELEMRERELEIRQEILSVKENALKNELMIEEHRLEDEMKMKKYKELKEADEDAGSAELGTAVVA